MAPEIRFRAYWNEHKGQWSVIRVAAGNRRVTFMADQLTMRNVTWHVTSHKGENGPQTCRSGHKNRHWFVEGELVSLEARTNGCLRVQPTSKFYGNAFTCRWADVHHKIERTAYVELTSHGTRYIDHTEVA